MENAQNPDQIIGEHNKSRHGGVEVAIAIKDDTGDLAMLLDHAIEILADHGDTVVTDDQFHKLVMKFRSGDLPMFVPASRWEDILEATLYEDAIKQFGRYRNIPSPDKWQAEFHDAQRGETDA